ncbi:uncharacterized mitochondrial protein AtMg00810-like [Macadamia integrifolia]|uniref:uncharacterized mitochondrial protein AtMg00810-like n=1 Tax=Macadamia integrifolia TaxID=60698 RepID=UPI001C4F30EF|nr:uncharacterized mitochondrial protein AtMg00810-like [Macadamia integrifolia]
MDSNLKLGVYDGEDFADKHQYRGLVGKLIYLIVTRSDISSAVGVIGQFMGSPKHAHWDVDCHILRSTTGYCTFLGGNIVSWQSRKQIIVARVNVEAEYIAMAHTTT